MALSRFIIERDIPKVCRCTFEASPDIEKVLISKANELKDELSRLEGEPGYKKKGRPSSLKGRSGPT